jgi:hypothetical protein
MLAIFPLNAFSIACVHETRGLIRGFAWAVPDVLTSGVPGEIPQEQVPVFQ